MPQVVAPRRPGIAMDFDFVTCPTPVALYLGNKCPSRDYRANLKDHNSMLLNGTAPKNDVNDTSKWKGNGFQGHVQYVTYFGKAPMRPCHLDTDVQMNTFPKENAAALNTSQMRNPEAMKTRTDVGPPTAEELRTEGIHRESLRFQKQLNGHTLEHDFRDNPHRFYYKPLHEYQERQNRLDKLTGLMQSTRAAGLASINPTMGTSGSLPNLKGLQTQEFFDSWKTSSPWAVDVWRSKVHPKRCNSPL